MEQMCKEYKIEYSPYPPYEVLSTGCLSYTEIITLKGVEDIVEVYYNTNRFHNSIKYLRNYFDNWFALYHKIYEYKTEKGVDSLVHNKQLAYTFLLEFAKNSIENFPDDDFKHILKLDFLRITSYNVCYTKLLRMYVVKRTFLLELLQQAKAKNHYSFEQVV